MNKFRYGDIVLVEGLTQECLVLGIGHDEDGEWISIIGIWDKSPTIYKHNSKSHKFDISRVTVISRHPQWVKFDIDNPECCPKIGHAYLVLSPSGKVSTYTFLYDLTDWSWFTHFMELPNPPQGHGNV